MVVVWCGDDTPFISCNYSLPSPLFTPFPCYSPFFLTLQSYPSLFYSVPSLIHLTCNTFFFFCFFHPVCRIQFPKKRPFSFHNFHLITPWRRRNWFLDSLIGVAQSFSFSCYLSSLPVRSVSFWYYLDVVTLNDANFEEKTQMTTGATTGRWFVKFYAPVHSTLLLST